MPPKPKTLCGVERRVIDTFEGMLSKEVYAVWVKLREQFFVFDEQHGNCLPREEARERTKLRRKLSDIERSVLTDEERREAIGKAIIDSIDPESVIAGIEASMAKGDASTLRLMAGIYGIGTGKEEEDGKAPATVVNIGFSMVQPQQQAIPAELEAIDSGHPSQL